MKLSVMIVTMAITALFSFQALACDGCGCKKGDDDDGDDNVRMSQVEAPGFCGEDKDDGDDN